MNSRKKNGDRTEVKELIYQTLQTQKRKQVSSRKYFLSFFCLIFLVLTLFTLERYN